MVNVAENHPLKNLHRLIDEATNADGIETVLRLIDESRSVDVEELARVTTRALRKARALGHSAHDQEERMLVGLLLPRCLRPSSDDVASIRSRSVLHELLSEWINELREGDRLRIRDRVLEECIRSAQQRSETVKPALLTIGAIGYRSRRIEKLLRAMLRREDETGDLALSITVDLGVRPSLLPRVRKVIVARSKVRPTSVLYALQQLSDPNLFGVAVRVLSHIRTTSNSPHMGVVAGLFSRMAGKWPERPRLQDRAWEKIVESTGLASGAVLNDGALAARCNSPTVVHDLLRQALRYDSSSESVRVGKWIRYSQLQECCRPRQLGGWVYKLSRSEVSVLHKDAAFVSQADGAEQWRTTESRLRKDACRTAFCLGYEPALDWIEEILTNEGNPYVKHEVLDAFSCFSIQNIPTSVLRLVTARYDYTQEGSPETLFPALGALRLTGSAATIPAFKALCRSGLSLRGELPMATADALTNISLALIRAGHLSIGNSLLNTALKSKSELNRSAAIVAIRNLVAAEAIGTAVSPKPTARSLAAAGLLIATRTALPIPIRTQALETVSLLKVGELSPDQFAAIKSIAEQEGEDELRWRAIQVLITRGDGGGVDETMVRWIGLEADAGRWTLRSSARLGSWQAYLVGLLYGRNPESLTPAAASAIRNATWEALAMLLPSLTPKLRHLGGKSTELASAAVDRIRSHQSRKRAETDMFFFLARLDPGRLVEEMWERDWGNWLPDSRVALADSLSEAGASAPKAVRRCEEMLTELICDGAYAVRRSACRSLASVSSWRLESLCRHWSRSGLTDARRRAAEAAGWLTGRPKASVADELLEKLRADREPSVRTAAARSSEEIQERRWASRYLRIVESSLEGGNAGILESFRFGQALSNVGDDQTVRHLERLRSNEALPAHSREWLRQIVKSVEERWQKVTQQWPEPWISLSGTIEELDGSVVTDATTTDVHVSLQLRPRSHPSQFGDWGGALTFTRNAWAHFGWTSVGTVTLRLSGRKDAAIAVTSWSSDGVAFFKGNSDYPEEL
jgi:hypothetical protein